MGAVRSPAEAGNWEGVGRHEKLGMKASRGGHFVVVVVIVIAGVYSCVKLRTKLPLLA